MLPLSLASPLHFLLETVGVWLAYRYYLRLRDTGGDPIEGGARLWIIVAATFGALLGSRLLGGLENPGLFWAGGGTAGWRYYWQSKTILGGLLGGLWAVEGVKRLLGVRQRSGDLFVYPLLLAMCIGRIGCLLMGVDEPTYGVPTQLPWGLDLGDGVARHPTALYEMVFLLLLWAGLRRMDQRRLLANGQRFMVFMTAYLWYRLWVGFIQPRAWTGLGLGSLQWAAVVGLLYYAVEWGREAQQARLRRG